MESKWLTNNSTASVSLLLVLFVALVVGVVGVSAIPEPANADDRNDDCATSCHGYPPAVDPHLDNLRNVTTCHHCHISTVDAQGEILPWGYHIDGSVQ